MQECLIPDSSGSIECPTCEYECYSCLLSWSFVGSAVNYAPVIRLYYVRAFLQFDIR